MLSLQFSARNCDRAAVRRPFVHFGRCEGPYRRRFAGK